MPGSAISRSWPAGPGPSTRPWSAAEDAGRVDAPGDPPGAAAPPRAAGRLQVLRAASTWSGWCPRSLVLAVAEVIVAELAGNRARARAVVRAWRWNLAGFRPSGCSARSSRATVGLSDKEIRLLQVGGSARLSSYFRRVFQHGFHGAHADELAAAEPGRPASDPATDGTGDPATVVPRAARAPSTPMDGDPRSRGSTWRARGRTGERTGPAHRLADRRRWSCSSGPGAS